VPWTLDEVTWPLTTARLRIRRAVADDLDAVYRYRRLESVTMWMTTAPVHFPERFTRPERLRGTLIIERNGTVVGDLLCNIENGYAQSDVELDAEGVEAEIGWCLDPAYGGQGYATEAASALLRACFADLGLRRVTAGCFADNVASWRLMERLGMRREAHNVRDSRHRSGRWLDGVRYALLAEEWAIATPE
jgi:RimJ/RimL family protein N-acetyltransferase